MPLHHDPLARLPRETRPPRALKERVIGDLERRGLLNRALPRRVPPGLAAAAAVVLVAAGAWIGRTTAPVEPGPLPEARFALLLYEGPAYDRSAPETDRVAEYAAWARTLGARLAMGEKLGAEERVLGPGPAADQVPTDTLAGFFLIDAAGWNEAMAIARDCPHLRYGGRVAVREIAT